MMLQAAGWVGLVLFWIAASHASAQIPGGPYTLSLETPPAELQVGTPTTLTVQIGHACDAGAEVYTEEEVLVTVKTPSVIRTSPPQTVTLPASFCALGVPVLTLQFNLTATPEAPGLKMFKGYVVADGTGPNLPVRQPEEISFTFVVAPQLSIGVSPLTATGTVDVPLPWQVVLVALFVVVRSRTQFASAENSSKT
ncbi:MAG: hypothetical protein AABX89_05660 [Candidatus Thermoplasmatota archaeon]